METRFSRLFLGTKVEKQNAPCVQHPSLPRPCSSRFSRCWRSRKKSPVPATKTCAFGGDEIRPWLSECHRNLYWSRFGIFWKRCGGVLTQLQVLLMLTLGLENHSRLTLGLENRSCFQTDCSLFGLTCSTWTETLNIAFPPVSIWPNYRKGPRIVENNLITACQPLT